MLGPTRIGVYRFYGSALRKRVRGLIGDNNLLYWTDSRELYLQELLFLGPVVLLLDLAN